MERIITKKEEDGEKTNKKTKTKKWGMGQEGGKREENLFLVDPTSPILLCI